MCDAVPEVHVRDIDMPCPEAAILRIRPDHGRAHVIVAVDRRVTADRRRRVLAAAGLLATIGQPILGPEPAPVRESLRTRAANLWSHMWMHAPVTAMSTLIALGPVLGAFPSP